jgi:hypothetical protein
VGPLLFLEGRRRNFGYALLLLEGARVIRFDVVQSFGHFGICKDRLVGCLDGRCRALRPSAADERQHEQKSDRIAEKGNGWFHGNLDATEREQAHRHISIPLSFRGSQGVCYSPGRLS